MEKPVERSICIMEEVPMPQMIAVDSAFEALIVEQALAFARQMQATAHHAADGTVLDQCELLALSKGRELLRTILTAAAQQPSATGRAPGTPSFDDGDYRKPSLSAHHSLCIPATQG
jgi:hypothetical protein